MSILLREDVRRVFWKTGARSHVVITIGNPLRGDDGAGPFLARRLQGVPGLEVYDTGDRPEDALNIVLPETPGWVTLVDAADFGGVPGEIRVIERAHIPEAAFSTHRISAAVICSLLAADTGAPVSVVGIQPASVALGKGLSPAVAATVEAVVAFIRKAFSCA